MMICSTAGELHPSAGQLYCSTGDRWDRLVVVCENLNCTAADLEAKLADYSFAITVGKELFVRSVSKLDAEA